MKHITTVLEVAGSVAIIVGAASLAAAAGWLVGGAIGWLYAWKLSSR